MLRLYITMILTCGVLFSNAQRDQSDLVFPKIRLGITPSALTHSIPGVQVSFDRKISDMWNFSLESAFLFTSPEGAKGIRLRPGIETIIVRSPWVSLTTGVHINYRMTIAYQHFRTLAGTGDFFRWHYNTRTIVSRLGLNVSENLMFKLSDRWTADLGSGIGLTSNSVSRGEIANPEEIIMLDGTRVFDPDIIPYLYLHFNLSYTIGK